MNLLAAEMLPKLPNPIPAPPSNPSGYPSLGGKPWVEKERTMWLTRQSTAEDPMNEKYWRDTSSPGRLMLCDLILKNLPPGKASVLDYGCHVGTSFRVLLEKRPNLKCYGLDPNHDAVSFMKEKLPQVVALEAEDEGFVAATNFPDQHVDVSFSCGVLYGLEPHRVRAVLKKLCAVSNVFVLGDELNRMYEKTTEESPWHTYFHPYRYWLRQNGFVVTDVIPAPSQGHRALNGFLVAKRLR